jgi:signal transduction histidine kinase
MRSAGTRFNALLDRLDGAVSQQRRFLADAAHELRSPLARIRGDIELALASPADAPHDRAVLARVADDIVRMSHLVDELLQLARADADLPETRLERLYLDDVVATAIGPWQHEARGQGIALSIEVEAEAPARLDVRLTERLLGVLVDNAIRYTPAGGAVRVRVRSTPEGARLEVEDTGIGIPADERPLIFDRFFRGVEARRHATEGSGLGLAIAAWVVAQHGARIGLDAVPGGGTCAWVQFLHPS